MTPHMNRPFFVEQFRSPPKPFPLLAPTFTLTRNRLRPIFISYNKQDISISYQLV